jgi:Fur family peroxide stress response transcriptional regulator
MFEDLKDLITKHNINPTMQRVIIYDVIIKLNNHPTAEDIFKYIQNEYPGISLSTVYNTLELFAKNCLLKIIKTDTGTLRYDPVIDSHHHIYCEDSKNVTDYYSSELDNYLKEYFKKNTIPGFEINEIQLQIKGNYKN